MSATMSARPQPTEDIRNAVTLRGMTPENLDAVMAIEQTLSLIHISEPTRRS